MKLRMSALALAAALLFPVSVRAVTPAAEDAIPIDAPSAVLMERSTGTLLYEKNAHERLAPASVTKIMTLLLVMEAIESGRISWEDTVITSETAAAKGGSQIYLEVGEAMSMTDMVKAVVVSSANDCATALAEHIAGSEEAFAAMMNERAAALGMNDTHFVNCTGLDDDPAAAEHLTSAYDIALMSRELLRHDAIRDYTTLWMDTVRDGQFGLSNTNKLVRFFSGTTGLKTGFTQAAGYCLSASAMRDGTEYIAVVLGCETSDKRFSSAKALLEYGFANYALLTPLPEQPAPIPVTVGHAAAVQPVLTDAGDLLVGKGEAANAACEVILPESVEAPVAAGQTLGSVRITSGETLLAELPLVAAEEVARLTPWEAGLRIFRAVCFAEY
ncbi:MAG: D-alanyl-D-alanine carboxypeptidase [Oscillospiraceae bacterium]|nr:D-alanyl-D-alanine carboxypeptidase [Oscillospiraceae bacterium]